MGVPYNFLQELSGAGSSIAPSEFDGSNRYIGSIQQANLFFQSDSGILSSTLNLYEKSNVSNERVLNSFTLDLSNTEIPNENSFIRLSLQNANLSLTPFETGTLSLSASGRNTLGPLETGSVYVSLSFNSVSGVILVPYDLNINFNYDVSGVIKDDFSNTLSFDLFMKSILRDNSSLEFVLNSGEYRGGPSMEQLDYGNLNLTILTGSYSGPE